MEGDNEIIVKAKTEEIPFISEFIENLMRRSGFGSKEIMEMQLAVEEACTNIALYAYPSRMGDIRINAETDHGLVLLIEDDGLPFDPTKRDPPSIQSDARERAIGGLGIYLIKTYVDEVHYEFRNGKNILRLIKRKGKTAGNSE